MGSGDCLTNRHPPPSKTTKNKTPYIEDSTIGSLGTGSTDHRRKSSRIKTNKQTNKQNQKRRRALAGRLHCQILQTRTCIHEC